MSKVYTVLDLLNMFLWQDEREEFVREFARQRKDVDLPTWMSQQTGGLDAMPMVVYAAFTFSESLQGEDYWYTICDRIAGERERVKHSLLIDPHKFESKYKDEGKEEAGI